MLKVKQIVFSLILLTCTIGFSYSQVPIPPAEGQSFSSGILAGDKQVGGNIFANIPLFNIDPASTTAIIADTGLRFGGGFNINVGYYITRTLSVGGAFSLNFNSDVNNVLLITAGIGPYLRLDLNIYSRKNSLVPLFAVPLTFELSGLYLNYSNLNTIAFALKPGISFFFIPPAISNWAFGVSVNYVFLPEIRSNYGQTRIGNYLQIGLGITYRIS